MITNAEITVYHREKTSKHEAKWTRYNYNNVWWFESKNANVNKGYDNADTLKVRLPYNQNINIDNFKIGDILIKGKITIDIESQQDLKEYDIYNITTLDNNNFGNNPHIYIGGK